MIDFLTHIVYSSVSGFSKLDEIQVRDGKGNNDRKILLPEQFIEPLNRQIKKELLQLEENILMKQFHSNYLLKVLFLKPIGYQSKVTQSLRAF